MDISELENLRQISIDMQQLDWQEELYWAKRGGQKELMDLLESGKTLEEAKRILGIE
jgi:hypothetical protein